MDTAKLEQLVSEFEEAKKAYSEALAEDFDGNFIHPKSLRTQARERRETAAEAYNQEFDRLMATVSTPAEAKTLQRLLIHTY